MANFPFFRFPYRNYYHQYYPNYTKIMPVENKEEPSPENDKKNNEDIHDNLEEPIFEIMGIRLYLDDLIILGLLFFLYKENVQDELLFLSLILLLLT